ncbi:MAG: SDR family oxidoreductase [Pseudomonadota bacterium]
MTKTILIAGASRGIGYEMARQAQARGDRVIATARSEDGRARLKALGVEAHPLEVKDEASANALSAAVTGPLDVLVVNAGVYRGRGGIDAEDSGADAWADVLMTNVAGPFLLARALLGHLGDGSNAGKIAILSSVMASSARAPGGGYLYRSSKAAVTNVACNLAAELRPRGIAVGSYHPGWVRTDMGGSGADISVEESASGLLSRFDALSLETTGVFEDYAGRTIPF